MESRRDMDVLDFKHNEKAQINVIACWRLAMTSPQELLSVKAHPFAVHWLIEMRRAGLLPDTFQCEEHWDEDHNVFLIVNDVRVDMDPTIPLEKDGTARLLLEFSASSATAVPSWIPSMRIET